MTLSDKSCIDNVIISHDNDVVNTFLQDFSSSGRENPWKEKKIETGKISDIYKFIDENKQCGWYWIKKAERLDGCASQLLFDVLMHTQTGETRKRLQSANFCRVRLCPMCGWRRARKIQAQMYKIISVAQQRQKLRYLFLTLTVPNVTAEELSDTITHLLKSYKKLIQYKQVDTAVVGTYRALEVTHNISNDTYHPHIHAILAVPPSYFRGKSDIYIPQSEWLSLWQKATGQSEITQVDVRAVKQGQDPDKVLKTLSEMCKYTVKTGDILQPLDMMWSADIVMTLDTALHKRRLVAYSGLLKDIHAELQLDDAVDGDLVQASDEDDKSPDEVKIGEEMYIWHAGYLQYVEDSLSGADSLCGNDFRSCS